VANVASAEKRNRQRLTRRTRNLTHLSKLRTYIKRVLTAVEAKDKKAKEVLAEAIQLIDKAAQKGVIKKETASRKISRLTKFVNAGAGATK
jgi:small subunit ribosomal protein S20